MDVPQLSMCARAEAWSSLVYRNCRRLLTVVLLGWMVWRAFSGDMCPTIEFDDTKISACSSAVNLAESPG